MPSLKGMRARTDQIKVPWGGEDTLVVWRPGLLTMAFYEELSDLNDLWREGKVKSSATFDRLWKMLAELIDQWDLTEEEGPISPTNPMVPITAAVFKTLPDGFTMELLDKIMEEGAGGKARQISDSGGRPGERRETSLGGQHSFG
jgi:hypothetical protein